jgi:hypothetical protein
MPGARHWRPDRIAGDVKDHFAANGIPAAKRTSPGWHCRAQFVPFLADRAAGRAGRW